MLRSSIQLLIIGCILCHCPPLSSAYAEQDDVWQNLGLYGGQVLDIAIDPSNPEKMFAATYFGDGLFMTIDGGRSWEPAGANLLNETSITETDGAVINRRVNGIDIAPSDSNVVWVVYAYWALVSRDGGLSWKLIENRDMQRDCLSCAPNDYARYCTTVTIDPNDPDVVYIGTAGANSQYGSGAIYKTTDGGSHWEKMNGGRDFDYTVKDIDVDTSNPEILWTVTNSEFIGGDHGSLYRSENGGESWDKIHTWDINTYWAVAVQPGTSDTVFTASTLGVEKHFRDGDGWHIQLPDPWDPSDFPVWPDPEEPYRFAARDVAFSIGNPSVVYAAWGSSRAPKISRSADGGETWTTYALENNFITSEIYTIAIHPQDADTIIAGDISLGVSQSRDGGNTWSPINNGINAVIAYCLSDNPHEQDSFAAGTSSGLFLRTAAGDWEMVFPEKTRAFAFHPTQPGHLFAGAQRRIFKLVDERVESESNRLAKEGRVTDIAIHPNAQDTIFATFSGPQSGEIYRSMDGGSQFRKIHEVDSPLNVIVIDPLDANHLYAGSGDFYGTNEGGNIFESVDGGDIWEPLGFANVVNDLLIDPENPKVIYAGCGRNAGTQTPLYKSSDGGETWKRSFEGIAMGQFNAVTDLAFHPHDKGVLYAATFEKGVYMSINGGDQWLSLGTPKYDVFAISTSTFSSPSGTEERFPSRPSERSSHSDNSSSLFAGTQGGVLQCTGTGVVAGRILDSATQTEISDALISNDLGLSTYSTEGDYMMVCPAGQDYAFTASADQFRTSTQGGVSVYGGDVNWLDFQLTFGEDASPIDDQPQRRWDEDYEGKGGDYCFISVSSFDRNGNDEMTFGASLLWIGCIILFFLPISLRFVPFCKKTMNKFICAVFLGSILVIHLTPIPANGATLFQNVGISSSPNPVGSGARAVGMGGAFIGVADDATAASWNPAGLMQLDKPEVSMVGTFFSWQEDLSSSAHPESDTEATNEKMNLNYLSAAYPFHYYKNMVVSLNYQRLYEFEREFGYTFHTATPDLDLVEKKQYDQNGYVSALGFAGAIDLTHSFSLGLTVNVWTDELAWDNGWEEKLHERAIGKFSSGATVITDTHISDEYSQFRGVNFNFGFLWNITNQLTLGAVLKTPFTASLRHEFTLSQYQTQVGRDDADIESHERTREYIDLDMPLSYGMGLSYRFSDAFTAAIDIYRTHWSNYALEDSQGNRFNPIDGNPYSQSDVDDTTQIRLGAEYLIIKPKTVIPIRFGVFYDPEPSGGSSKDYFGFSLGSGFAYKKFIFDAAYQFRAGDGVNADNLIPASEGDFYQHTLMTSLIIHF